MITRRYARFILGAAILAAGLAAPAAAAPSDADPAKLAAVTEKVAETGNNKRYMVGQGEVVPAALGVTNVGDAPVKGLVVQVRVLDDLNFGKKYDNCWYAVDSNQDTAWCEFDSELGVDATLALVGPMVMTAPDARADKATVIVFRWSSKEWADAHGGLQALADGWAGQGTKAVRGTEGTLTLEPRSLPLSTTKNPLNFAYVGLVTPPTAGPTSTPGATPTVTPGATPTATTTAAPTVAPTSGAPGGEDGEGGGLPVTGAQTAAVAGVGGALLLLGGAGYVIARRRRTRFVA